MRVTLPRIPRALAVATGDAEAWLDGSQVSAGGLASESALLIEGSQGSPTRRAVLYTTCLWGARSGKQGGDGGRQA